MPISLEDVHDSILDPRDTYEDPRVWNTKAIKLSKLFRANFEKYTDNEAGKSLVSAGPQLEVEML